MVQKMMVSMVISFILKEIQNLQATADWDKLKKEMDTYIAAIVPNEMLCPIAVKIADTLFDNLRSLLSRQDILKQLLTMLVENKYGDAVGFIKGLFAEEIKGKDTHLASLVQSLDHNQMVA